MSRLLLVALLLGLPSAAGSHHSPDEDEDGWFDQPVDEDRYPRYRARPYYGPPVYDPEPRSYDTLEARCDREYQIYRESIDCFNRFRNQNGSLRGEAYRYCTQVMDPSPRCGPPRNW